MAKYIVFAVYALILIGIAVISARKTKTLSDFFLGGRKVGGWMSAFAYGTTYFSAVVFIGYAGSFGWQLGVSATWIGVGNAVIGSLLAWLVLAKATRRMTHHLDASTMPDFFGKRYQSRGLKITSAVIIFVFLVPYCASVYQGLGYLFEQVFQIDYIWCMAAMAVLTGLYLLLGGYVATVWSDFFQGFIMLTGIVLVIIFVLTNPTAGGLSSGIAKLNEAQEGLGSIFGPEGQGMTLVSLIVLTSLGTWGLPQMVHKFYAIRDNAAIRRGTIVSTIFALIVAGGSYFTGAFGRLFANNQIPVDPVTGANNFDMVMPQMLMQALPEVLLGVVIVLVLSASMSTLSSVVLVSSSAVSMDLVHGVIAPKMSQKRVTLIMRLLCLLFVAISFFLATNRFNAIVTLMSFSWGAISGSFLSPFLYGLFWKKTSRAGAWSGFATGIGVSLALFIAYGFNAKMAPTIGAIAMVASLVVVPVVSLLTPRTVPGNVEEMFAETAEVATDA